MVSNLKIMVVEDEPLLLEAIGNKLEKEGVKAILCSDGKQAIDQLANSSDLPDAIWLDYYLKDMDGLSFMGSVKQNPKLQNIPVIVVSNSASTQKVNTMLALGAKKYLLKAQYRLEDIVKIIQELTNN
ncbi:hypothetical protein A3C25_04460 [Candidatus Roizmanbacteria bacterium RIFCSPHIGHO2_02_FULL_38_11]|uniref:Response regulatory domain-containing protein n=1 Tax=Candidatus Roizmanbacteria bacterium RIFCSPHIGHO2_02_FULL_38_11 TaxID=1802039 RepID=A0A1F7GXQ1_9BACT|nr:MAG: hypothetical protein A3C25_04460 [Candidatus Roizmanbacteria bacterium RIFCSPHIGHO2_02_FULL_38_11]